MSNLKLSDLINNDEYIVYINGVEIDWAQHNKENPDIMDIDTVNDDMYNGVIDSSFRDAGNLGMVVTTQGDEPKDHSVIVHRIANMTYQDLLERRQTSDRIAEAVKNNLTDNNGGQTANDVK